MRLREPFSGYKLASGHYMFHLAYLIGSCYLDISFGRNIEPENLKEAQRIQFLLKSAHMLVPILKLIQFFAEQVKWHAICRILEVICIFYYQTTMFEVQYFMMKTHSTVLRGYNLWFTIEIISFYGYIFSAILYIFENQISSSYGRLNKCGINDEYQHDFINYHRMDLDWMAFLTITLLVNFFIMFYNHQRSKRGDYKLDGPLHAPMWLLLFVHITQFIFYRRFQDEHRRINKKHKWIWSLHAIIYTYVLYCYIYDRYFAPQEHKEQLESRYIWIPMDCILQGCVAAYYFIYVYHESRHIGQFKEHNHSQMHDHKHSSHKHSYKRAHTSINSAITTTILERKEEGKSSSSEEQEDNEDQLSNQQNHTFQDLKLSRRTYSDYQGINDSQLGGSSHSSKRYMRNFSEKLNNISRESGDTLRRRLFKKRVSSAFATKDRKERDLVLTGDSTSMAYAACLKSQFNVVSHKDNHDKSVRLELSQEQIADVFMNAFIVHMLQIAFVVSIWMYAIEHKSFAIQVPDGIEILCARFIASLLMHINVEKDVRNGISLMKYAVNHYKNFKNVHVAFVIALLMALSSLLVEFTVVLVLTSIESTLSVIMKYVSLAAIANIPRFYYGSIANHKLLAVAGHKLHVTNERNMKLLRDAPRHIKFYRFCQKSVRLFYCCWSYYFMPFTSMAITYVVCEWLKIQS